MEKNSILNYVFKKKIRLLNYVFEKKTTAKLSLALFLGISFCYCFFKFSEFIFFFLNMRFFLIHHFFHVLSLLCYFSDPYIINMLS